MLLLPFHFKGTTLLEQGRTNLTALENIKIWFQNEFSVQIQDEFLILFLLSCYNNVETTKTTIRSYLNVKNKCPEMFNTCDIDKPELKKILEIAEFCVIPGRTDENSAIIWGRIIDSNYRKFDLLSVLKIGCMLLHFTQISDPPDFITVVFDIKGGSLMHLTCIKMSLMLAFLEYIQEGIPLKIKSIQVLNSNYVFDKLLNLMKKFIKTDIISCIKIHPAKLNMEEYFSNFLPSKLVPTDYGGELPTLRILTDQSVKDLQAMKSFFEQEELLRLKITQSQ